MSDPFIAEIRIVGFNYAPRGWAFCQGQLLPIAQNTALFSLVGTTYGGNGTTNFNLPNMSDRMPMHPGSGPGLTPRSLGETDGAAVVTLVSSEMPSHQHTVTANNATATQSNPANNFLAKNLSTYSTTSGVAVALAAGSLGSQGGSQAHENRSPCLSMNFVIALQGVFPPRS